MIMKQNLITDIIQGMLPYLNNAQSKRLQQVLRSAFVIKTHLNPIPEFKLSFEKDEDKTFVIVEVMKGQQTPYY